MTEFIPYENFSFDIASGVHDFPDDTFKIALTDRAPVVGSDTVFADIDELPAGNGYLAGGMELSTKAVTQDGIDTLMTNNNIAFISHTGDVGPFRYTVLYNVTKDRLMGYWDRFSEITLHGLVGDPFSIFFGDDQVVVAVVPVVRP